MGVVEVEELGKEVFAEVEVLDGESEVAVLSDFSVLLDVLELASRFADLEAWLELE